MGVASEEGAIECEGMIINSNSRSIYKFFVNWDM